MDYVLMYLMIGVWRRWSFGQKVVILFMNRINHSIEPVYGILLSIFVNSPDWNSIAAIHETDF
jgi:hypothetical protein